MLYWSRAITNHVSFKFGPISLNSELNFSNYSVFNNSSLTPNMWINCTRHVLIFIRWDTGEIKAYLLSTQHQKTTKCAPFFNCPSKALTAVCASVLHLMSSSESLWRKSSCPHPGLPVKTNRHGDQACQFPTVGGDWDIIGVSNERRQRIRVLGPRCSRNTPESRCFRIMLLKPVSATPRKAWGTNEGSGR